MLTRQELLAALEEGLENERITPHTAAYIAAEVLGIDAHDTDYYRWYSSAGQLLESSVASPA